MEIPFRIGMKHCGEMRKCWLPAFSPFPAMFSKGFFSKVGIMWFHSLTTNFLTLPKSEFGDDNF